LKIGPLMCTSGDYAKRWSPLVMMATYKLFEEPVIVSRDKPENN